MKCKRCNRVLTNEKSVKRGYGDTCYRIVQLEEKNNKPNKELADMKNKWNRLSLKYTVLEKKIKKLEEGGVRLVDKSEEEAYRQAREKHKNLHRPEQDSNAVHFTIIVKELNVLFTRDEDVKFDYHDVLKPVDPRETIEKPPKVIKRLELIH